MRVIGIVKNGRLWPAPIDLCVRCGRESAGHLYCDLCLDQITDQGESDE